MGMVTFVDETTSGERRDAVGLEIAEERLALRELIRRRACEEVVDGGDTGRAYERAIEAFGRNGFLVLVGDRQIVELDEELELGSATEVTFLRLVPLVGG
ncbi:hypothetical protein OG883_03025 [Streptomyces sp. NBC_01142]|uniref:hypothetical protein n=1 Tax=Streptomyces sp. NBC_01142 TaxID=2975865 RepID=UPI00224E0FCA|nr:hypothetical protein [Streptomyces sp. NBC_01142]MCX4818891.1 hypothetical protein [Streptomyces sp. NBC_01142]